MRTSFLPVIAGVVAFTVSLSPAHAADVQKVQSFLFRPPQAPQAEAVGRTRMQRHNPSGDERLSVQIRNVDGGVAYDLFIEQPLGSDDFQFVATLENLEYSVGTSQGDELPLGAMSLDELTGLRLKVESAGETVLQGYFPCALDLTRERLRAVGPLMRPNDGPDSDARGRIAMRSVPAKGFHDFAVGAVDVDITRTHRLFVEGLSGQLELVGELQGGKLPVDHDGNVTWKANTKKPGDELPLDVGSVSELLGRKIAIRIHGETILRGTLPDGFGGNGKPMVAMTDLDQPPGASDGNAEGRVRMRIQPGNGGERFELWLKHVDTHQEISLWVQDPEDSDTLVFSSVVSPGCSNGDGAEDGDGSDDGSGDADDGDCPHSVEGRLLFLREIDKGQALPLGVAKNQDLVGRRVEIRAGDDVVLQGIVPSFEAAQEKRFRARIDLELAPGSPQGKATGRLVLKSNPAKGDERFEIKTRKLDLAGVSCRVYVVDEEPGGGPVAGEAAGEVEAAGAKKGLYRRRTRDGDMLPLEVTGVRELAGRRIEIRDTQGNVYLVGTVPIPEE